MVGGYTVNASKCADKGFKPQCAACIAPPYGIGLSEFQAEHVQGQLAQYCEFPHECVSHKRPIHYSDKKMVQKGYARTPQTSTATASLTGDPGTGAAAEAAAAATTKVVAAAAATTGIAMVVALATKVARAKAKAKAKARRAAIKKERATAVARAKAAARAQTSAHATAPLTSACPTRSYGSCATPSSPLASSLRRRPWFFASATAHETTSGPSLTQCELPALSLSSWTSRARLIPTR